MLNTSRSPLPGKYDTLLLRAALLQGCPALDAYRMWRNTLDLDALDFGSQRVLPLLVNNLTAHGVDDEVFNRFRGVGRFAWYMNQILIRTVRPVLHGLNRSKTPFALLKGMAFVASIPNQLQLRAMTDVDLLVHQDDAASAMHVLEKSGWHPYYGNSKFVNQELIDRTASCVFQHGEHGNIDLHWSLNERNRWPDADAALWGHLISVELAGESCRAPCFEDQVLHTFVHGAAWNGIGTIRWVTDAAIILRNSGSSFDWSYFLEQCRWRRAVIQVTNCLQYLREHLDVSVPDKVMSELHRERVPLVEFLDYRYRARNPATLNQLASSLLAFQNFRGSLPANANVGTAVRLWIKHQWHANSVLEAAALAVLAFLDRPPWLRKFLARVWCTPGNFSSADRQGKPNLDDGPIDLSLSGDPKGALLYGWSDPEADGRWTDGPEAALAFEAGPVRGPMSITISVFAMVPEIAPEMRVEIWANGHRLEDWSFNHADDLSRIRTLTIPDSAQADRFQVVTFVIRHPRSPQSLGISPDVRRLGLFVQKVGLKSLNCSRIKDYEVCDG